MSEPPPTSSTATPSDETPEEPETAKAAPPAATPPAAAVSTVKFWMPVLGNVSIGYTRKSKRVKNMSDLERDEFSQKIGLRRMYAAAALTLVFVQIAIADIAFYKYGTSKDWELPTTAINGWLAATVVQTIGIVLVITRSLFPPDKK